MKLENLGNTFTKWGLYASLIILAANLINWIITVSVSPWSAILFKRLIDMLTLTITVVIVAVPEGLPLSISLSLAFSVMRMKDDGLLVKELVSPEIMGGVDEICTGKTATLTKNDMKVAHFYSQSLLIANSRKNTILNCELFPEVVELIKESILYNCEARIEMDDKAFYIPVGNGTEVGFVRFLQDAEIPVHELIRKKLGHIEAVVPFSTLRKRSVTAVRLPDMEDTVRVYVKGAPEYVVNKCIRTFKEDGKKQPMSDEQLSYIIDDIIRKKFTTQGYRCLAFAYKDYPLAQFQELREQHGNFESDTDKLVLEKDLTFLGVFALQDDLRDKVTRSVQFAKRGMINIRMVSGDNIDTATAVAIKAGILTEEESKHHNACMSGEEFRKLVGEVRKEIDADGKERSII
jgi:magnesium-transporting ATPase (P-type)